MHALTLNKYRDLPSLFRIITICLITLIAYLILSRSALSYLLEYSIICTIVIFLSLLSSTHIRKFWKGLDWRLQIVIIATAIVIVVTWYASFVDKITDVATFLGAFYAAWVASLAFFLVLGVIGTIVSLAKPENEPFETRARILLRGQTGPHIDYAINKFRNTLEHFADSTATTVNIRVFDGSSRKYGAELEDRTVVKSYITDTETRYDANISMKEATLPPTGYPKCALYYCRVGGVPQSTEEFDDQISRKIPTTVHANSSCVVEHGMSIWMRSNDEAYDHEVSRFTRSLSLRINNHIGNNNRIKLRIKLIDWATHQEITIDSGDTVEYKMLDIASECLVYQFYIDA